MLRLSAHIEVGDYQFVGVVSVAVSSSWDNLTDTATIVMPSQVRYDGRLVNLAEERVIKKSDSIKIELGYNDENEPVFEGFVSDVVAGSPVEIKCEDFAWLLKRENHTLSFRSVTLAALLQQIVPAAVSVDAVAVELGQFRLSNVSAAQVLEELKKTYRLHSWFRGSTLYAGLAYRGLDTAVKVFRFEHNIIEDELSFRSKDEVKIKVKAISMLPNNKKIEVEVGNPDGEQRTLHFYNKDKETLKLLAEERIEQLKYDGYRGSFTTFGQPAVKHGDLVRIEDPRYNRSGTYLVKSVETAFGKEGYRQTIELDREA